MNCLGRVVSLTRVVRIRMQNVPPIPEPAALKRAGDERAQVEEGRDGEEDGHERGVVDLPRKPRLRTARVTRKAAFGRTIWWLSLM